MSGQYECPDRGYRWYSELGLARHREKPHHKCPLCPRSYIRVERHLLLSHYGPFIEELRAQSA